MKTKTCLKIQNRKKQQTPLSRKTDSFSLPVIMSSKRPPPIRYLDLYKVKHRNISRRTSQNVKNNTKSKSLLNFLPQGIGVRLVRYIVIVLVNLFLPDRCTTDLTCMKDVHTRLKCNLVISIVKKSIWDLKIDKITFQIGVYILHSS